MNNIEKFYQYNLSDTILAKKKYFVKYFKRTKYFYIKYIIFF